MNMFDSVENFIGENKRLFLVMVMSVKDTTWPHLRSCARLKRLGPISGTWQAVMSEVLTRVPLRVACIVAPFFEEWMVMEAGADDDIKRLSLM